MERLTLRSLTYMYIIKIIFGCLIPEIYMRDVINFMDGNIPTDRSAIPAPLAAYV